MSEEEIEMRVFRRVPIRWVEKLPDDDTRPVFESVTGRYVTCQGCGLTSIVLEGFGGDRCQCGTPFPPEPDAVVEKGVPSDFEPFVWCGRLVKLLDGHTWALSRKGAHDDFDYAAPDPDAALAGTFPPHTIYDISSDAETGELRFWTTGGSLVLSGTDNRDFRIDREKRPEGEGR